MYSACVEGVGLYRLDGEVARAGSAVNGAIEGGRAGANCRHGRGGHAARELGWSAGRPVRAFTRKVTSGSA